VASSQTSRIHAEFLADPADRASRFRRRDDRRSSTGVLRVATCPHIPVWLRDGRGSGPRYVPGAGGGHYGEPTRLRVQPRPPDSAHGFHIGSAKRSQIVISSQGFRWP
jgi:hypothetical protein